MRRLTCAGDRHRRGPGDRGPHRARRCLRSVVVLAAARSQRQARTPVGVEIPQRFVRQTVVLTEPVPAVTRAAAWTGDLFIRQDKSGSLRLAGATRNEVVLDASSLSHTRLFLKSYLANRSQLRVRVGPRGLARAAATRSLGSAGGDLAVPAPDGDDVAFCLQPDPGLLPDLAELRLLPRWAGEIDATPDALPVLECACVAVRARRSRPASAVTASASPRSSARSWPRSVNGEDVPFDLRPFRSSRFTDGSSWNRPTCSERIERPRNARKPAGHAGTVSTV